MLQPDHQTVPQRLRLERLMMPQFLLCGRLISSFQFFGYTGLALAIGLTWSLVLLRGLSLWVAAGVTLLFPVTFLVLAMLTKIVTGRETLVYYRHMLAYLGSAALLLNMLGQPPLPYLDIAALGIGVFIACGRLGCLLAGCCHGRPHRWGVRYGTAHVAAGFNQHLVGVRLFPTQLVESGAVWGITLVGLVFLLINQLPGMALTWYLVAYAIVRFGLEFWRGDAVRPYAWGFSEAQWTSLAVLIGVVVAGLAGWLPLDWWQIAMIVGIALAIAIGGWHWATRRLLLPAQIAELAALLDTLSGHTAPIVDVAETSDGLRISASILERDGRPLQHYTISRPAELLTMALADSLAMLIVHLRHPNSAYQIIAGSTGIFHVLIAATI
jgi:prolipoprotein diacylglyceryltransferase